MQLEDPDREGRAFMRRDTLTDEEGINRFGTVRRGVDWRYFVVDS